MLRFILHPNRNDQCRISISIHPMLRFILQSRSSLQPCDWFQYIPCYGLSSTTNLIHLALPNFNTSHVTVYRYASDWYHPTLPTFQYIPCYGLSFFSVFSRRWYWYFNTSHVTVYQGERRRNPAGYRISIHPMLRFIFLYPNFFVSNMNISIHPMLRFIAELQF